MSNLVPEQRVDKNGKLVKRHVRNSVPETGRKPSLPSPALPGATTSTSTHKAAQKPFKPRPKQIAQRYHSISATFRTPDEELESNPLPEWSRHYNFTASDVEILDVLSVARPSNALHMLHKGVRSAEEAKQYLEEHGASHRIQDYSHFTQEALKRGISGEAMMEELRYGGGYRSRSGQWVSTDEERANPHYMDMVELRSIQALEDQNEWIKEDVMDGNIKVSDIKAIGSTRLKTYNRLHHSKEALQVLNKNPDAKFSVEDMKNLLDRCTSEGADQRDYRIAVSFLISEGPEFIDRLDKIKTLTGIEQSTRHFSNDRERTVYAVKYKVALDEPRNYYPQDMDELYKSGVDPEQAAGLINEGMSVRGAIANATDGTEKSLAEGWL